MFATASAQKLSNTDLQGEWKLSALDNNGAHVDIISGEITISPELKTQLTPDMISQISDGLKQSITKLKVSDVVFTGNNVKQNMAGKEKKGTFTIMEQEGKQHASFNWDNNTTSESSIWIKNKQLHIQKFEQGQIFEFIYNKA